MTNRFRNLKQISQHPHRRLMWILLFSFSASTALAQTTSQSLIEIIRKACSNEVEHVQHDHAWAVQVKRLEDGHEKLFHRVETSEGDIQRLILVDGHPAAGPEKEKSEALLHTLLTNSAARAKEATSHRSDINEEIRIFSRVPQIYLFADAGRNGTMQTIHFAPNPSFQPTDYRERVLHVLKGEIQIDVEKSRIVEVNAIVSEPLSFGFGILGSLKQGGSIHLLRAPVREGLLKTRESAVDLDGKLVLLKDIGKHQREALDGYIEAPEGCDILCGLHILDIH